MSGKLEPHARRGTPVGDVQVFGWYQFDESRSLCRSICLYESGVRRSITREDVVIGACIVVMVHGAIVRSEDASRI